MLISYGATGLGLLASGVMVGNLDDFGDPDVHFVCWMIRTWRSFLQSSLSRDSHLLDAGGDSISATRILAHINSALGLSLGLGTLLKAPTPYLFAQTVSSAYLSNFSTPNGLVLPDGTVFATQYLHRALGDYVRWFLEEPPFGLDLLNEADYVLDLSADDGMFTRFMLLKGILNVRTYQGSGSAGAGATVIENLSAIRSINARLRSLRLAAENSSFHFASTKAVVFAAQHGGVGAITAGRPRLMRLDLLRLDRTETESLLKFIETENPERILAELPECLGGDLRKGLFERGYELRDMQLELEFLSLRFLRR